MIKRILLKRRRSCRYGKAYAATVFLQELLGGSGVGEGTKQGRNGKKRVKRCIGGLFRVSPWKR